MMSYEKEAVEDIKELRDQGIRMKGPERMRIQAFLGRGAAGLKNGVSILGRDSGCGGL